MDVIITKGPKKGTILKGKDAKSLECIKGMYEIYETKEATGPTENKERKRK
jgi:hypothetical protein